MPKSLNRLGETREMAPLNLTEAAPAVEKGPAQPLKIEGNSLVTRVTRERNDWAEQAGLDVQIVNQSGMPLILIPPGEFNMGSPESEENRSSDEVLHRVKLTQPFYLGVTEVTRGQWKRIMETEPWGDDDEEPGDRDKAVTHVNWLEAIKFCNNSVAARESPCITKSRERTLLF